MFRKALIAFLALPGVFAFLVPALIIWNASWASSPTTLGLIVVAAGSLLLLWCVRTFYVVGKGTLAPWAPPIALVASGPYRFSRNPMYVAVICILVGWALTFRLRALAIYALSVAIGFHLRVVLAEEPTLAKAFPPEWEAYRRAVPRWLWPKTSS